jgi:hypothetical protein
MFPGLGLGFGLGFGFPPGLFPPGLFPGELGLPAEIVFGLLGLFLPEVWWELGGVVDGALGGLLLVVRSTGVGGLLDSLVGCSGIRASDGTLDMGFPVDVAGTLLKLPCSLCECL